MRDILFRGFVERENGDTTICVAGRTIKGQWVEGFYREQPAPLECIGELGLPKSYIICRNPRQLSDWGMPISMCEYEIISWGANGRDDIVVSFNGAYWVGGSVLHFQFSEGEFDGVVIGTMYDV